MKEGLSSVLCRAARAGTRWSREDLAKRARVSRGTLEKFENGRGVPNRNNLGSIRAAFEAAGIEFSFGADGRQAVSFPEA